MSKLVIFLITFLTISLQGISQDDYSGNTDLVIKRIHANIYSITRIQNDGMILYTGFLKSKKPLIKSGVFTFYSPSGHLAALGYYDNDILTGEWMFFKTKTDPSGMTDNNIPRIVDYDKVHTYMRNERLVKPVPIPITEVSPSYNGGDYRIEFEKYITENLIYPAFPRYEGIEGQVLIQFRISEKGEVREPAVVRSSHKDFTVEALRLIIEAPDWEPGIHNKKAVNDVINWTIDFRMQ